MGRKAKRLRAKEERGLGDEDYEIRVEGLLDESWSEELAGLAIRHEAAETILVGKLPDQTALHGLLAQVRDLGLQLILVRRLAPEAMEQELDRKGER